MSVNIEQIKALIDQYDQRIFKIAAWSDAYKRGINNSLLIESEYSKILENSKYAELTVLLKVINDLRELIK